MGKVIKGILFSNAWFAVFSSCAIVLLVASFLMPPTGVIDDSVLKGVGELFGFAALWSVLHAVNKGIDARIKHGKTEVTIGDLNAAAELNNEMEEYESAGN